MQDNSGTEASLDASIDYEYEHDYEYDARLSLAALPLRGHRVLRGQGPGTTTELTKIMEFEAVRRQPNGI